MGDETGQDRFNERRIADEVLASGWSPVIARAHKQQPFEVLDFRCYDLGENIVCYSEAKQVRVEFGTMAPPIWGYCVPLRKVRKAEEHWERSMTPTYLWIRFRDGLIRTADISDWDRNGSPYMMGQANRPYSEWEPHVTIKWDRFAPL